MAQPTTGTVKQAPVDDLSKFGFHLSTVPPRSITASAPTASAVRSMAPRFPGFSRPSTTMIKDPSEGARPDRWEAYWGNTAMIPSDLFR